MIDPSGLYEEIVRKGRPDQQSLGYIDQVSYTYDDLRLKVDEYARRLTENGVTRHCPVAVYIPNSPTLIILLLAIWKLNAQAVLLDSRLKPFEVERNLAVYKPRFLVAAPPHQSVFSNFVAEAEFSIKRLHEHDRVQDDGGDHSPALVLFTSGSTGNPKVVGRTASSILEELENFLCFPGAVQSGDVVMVLCSVSHSFGLITGVLTSLYVGARVILCGNKAQQIIQMFQKHKATVIYGVPFHYEMMAMCPGESIQLPSLRSAVSAGEPLKRETHRAFLQKFGVSIGELYGMSETGTLTADLLGTAPGTVGYAMKGREIVADDRGIHVKLPQSPYLGASDADRYQGGYLFTQDIGRFDEDGRLRHLGRSDSLVIIGGRKVYLREIEETLRSYDGIKEVVVLYDTVIQAYFTADERFGIEDFTSWCQSMLSNYKIPKIYRRVEEFPRTSTGKLLRRQLDQLAVRDEFRL